MVTVFSADQFAAFAAPARTDWIARAAQRLHDAYPAYFNALAVTPADLVPLCQAVEHWAAEMAITGERDVSQLCCVATTLGHRFWDDPRFAGYLNASVGQPDLAASDRTRLLLGHARDWLATLWHNDTLGAFAARLAHHVRLNQPPTTDRLRAILPGHWRLFDEGYNAQLLAWAGHGLPPARMPAQQTATLACALGHGMGWRHDPQYRRIAERIAAAATPDDLAHALSAIYGDLA